jgi:YihY family inner membrane protein
VLARIVAWVDRLQRRSALLGFPIAVLKKFGEDRATSLAVLVAYYAFFSLFPLLLAFVSILGFVLEGNPSLQQEVLDSALARIPVIGPQLSNQVEPLTGSGVALAIGLLGALWGGLGVAVALRRAFDAIGDVPRVDQPSGLKARAIGLLVLAILGVTLIAASALTGLAAGGGIGATGDRILAVAGSLVVNAVALTAVFSLLTSGQGGVRGLLPGIALASVGAIVLQLAGGWFINRTIANAGETYGTFALVIGLLTWFLLAANLLLMAAEVNAVRHWKLWPRSLTGALEPADRRALRRSTAATLQDPRQEITVTFGDGDDDRA